MTTMATKTTGINRFSGEAFFGWAAEVAESVGEVVASVISECSLLEI
jgi:hypothetical protein